MPEALFTCLLVLGTVALLQGLRSAVWSGTPPGGALLGVAALTRPAAQLVVVLLPLVLLLVGRPPHAILRPTLAAGAALAVVIMPWVATVYADTGSSRPARHLASR